MFSYCAAFKISSADDTGYVRGQLPASYLPLHYVFVVEWLEHIGWDVRVLLPFIWEILTHRLSVRLRVLNVCHWTVLRHTKRPPQHWRRECKCSRHLDKLHSSSVGFRVARLARLGFGFVGCPMKDSRFAKSL